MKIYILLISFLTLLPALFFTGCVPSKPDEEIEILPSERLINKLEANRRRIKTFEGTGTIHVKSPQFDNSASFQVKMIKPDSIQLSIMGPFGIELAQAVVTENNFIFYDALQNTAYTGEASDDVLRTIFRIDLSFNDLLDAFVGSVNLTRSLYRSPNNYEVVYDEYMLTYIDSVSMNKSKYIVDVRQLGIKDYELFNSSEQLALKGIYSDFKLIEGVAVPQKIIVKNGLQNQTITINYKSVKANDDGIYLDFQIPEDATVIGL